MDSFWTSVWRLVLDHGSQIGPVIGGVSLFIGAIAAWCTLIFYHRQVLREEWIANFRAIFAEFWDNDEIATARGWITSDKEYKDTLLPVLEKRMQDPDGRNSLDEEDNRKLELFDRLLAIMTRVVSFGKTRMNKPQKRLWEALFAGFWIPALYARVEARPYVRKYFKFLWDEIELFVRKTAA